MRVRIKPFTVDVDADAWARDYGVAKSEVREDVQRYIENGIRDHLASLGLTIQGE